MQKDYKAAWADYLRLCKAGGSQSFLGLVELADLKSPFNDSTLQPLFSEVASFLDSVNDKEM